MGWREDITKLSKILDPKWMDINKATNIGELFEKLKPKRLLEVGTLQGTGSCYISTMAKYYDGQLTTVDIPWSNSQDFLNRGFILAETQITKCDVTNVEIIRKEGGAEEWFLEYFNNPERKPLNFVYIDGGHEWPNVSSHIFSGMAALCIGGWMVVDDIHNKNWPDVGVAWNQLISLMGVRYYEKNGQGFIRRTKLPETINTSPLNKQNTYCHQLWDNILINPDGKVYSCCLSKPAILGNINDQKLIEICDSQILQSCRKDSIDGCLKCYENCILINKTETIPNKFPEYANIIIRVGYDCNIHCLMCKSRKDIGTGQKLEFDKIKDNLDLTKFKSINITGGEPFSMPITRQIVDYCIKLHKPIGFCSNGLLIDDQWAEDIAKYADYLYISINAGTKETHKIINRGSNLDTVLSNIQKIRNIREKLGKRQNGTIVILEAHMTIVPQNIHEIPLFVENYKKWGFDTMSFCNDEKSVEYINNNPELKKKLRSELVDIIDKIGTKPTSYNTLRALGFME